MNDRSAAAQCCLAALVLLGGCATAPPRLPPPPDYLEAVPAGFPPTVRGPDDNLQRLNTEVPQAIDRMLAAARGGPLQVLALSGGGAGAAFGAGALVGWTARGTRPDFELVTGVSAGALLAPFAFLGPQWDAQLRDAVLGTQMQQLLQRRWIGAWAGSSVYRGEPLQRLVDHYVTDDLVRAVAAKAANGGLLLIATTDLDHERAAIWNLGAIAAQGGPAARRLFCDLLVASASIPGVFPPVILRVEDSGHPYDELHVDGATTASLFIAPEIVSVQPDRLAGTRGAVIYAIVNGQLGSSAQDVPASLVSVLRRSVGATLQSSSRAAVEVAFSEARQNGMEFHLTQIPEEFPYQGAIDLRAASLRALFDLGQRCALADRLWSTPLQEMEQQDLPGPLQPYDGTQCPAPAPAPGPAPAQAPAPVQALH